MNYNPQEALEPPESFRALSVVPSREDLMQQRPFVRPNIVAGSYRDVDHYLDVQFRLLREDCFGPLREGIAKLIRCPNAKKFDKISVYRNVKFVRPNYTATNKIGEVIQFDEETITSHKAINWASNKRLIYGSLILLTKDNCKSFITGTILDRDIKLLKKGKILVSIVNNEADENLYYDSYTMIESEVYFEPYFHGLKALQDPSFPKHLAMHKYIVYVDPHPNPPKYLSLQGAYLTTTKEALGFNESQFEAYKLALTHEFAVIQGPPGTGKTFLGVKVAKTLLQNLNTNGCRMLVICYTNHALDQFLEAILSITPSVVRIGGQSRNEAMEKINLNTLRKNSKVKHNLKIPYQDSNKRLNIAIHELKLAQERLYCLSTGVIAYERLRRDMPEDFSRYYRNTYSVDPLEYWLFQHMNYIDFIDIVTEAKIFAVKKNDESEDDEKGNFQGVKEVNMSFSVVEMETKLKTLIASYITTTSSQEKRRLERAIIDCKSKIMFFNNMSVNRTRQPPHISRNTDFCAMSMADRWSLYYSWANVIINKAKEDIKSLQEKFESANTINDTARTMKNFLILKDVKVIGMTTSGATRERKLLQALAPPIVIVEEAAEVLEQHIITSLTKSCQHLILIGDHKQLRPSAAHYELARHFNIEISLFERMIKNGIHSRRLGVQHRMRPEIAALISPHIYPDLQNHPSVEKFPNVRGMADNLFFLTHNYKEEKELADSASHLNEAEADMTLRLANYLMLQGYKASDVTILAAYSGQMNYMAKRSENYTHLKNVKITSVDNYQGEESKIILLSLVRNNNDNKVGFLSTDNRVCVALSRAREGLYIFGNMDMLKKRSPLWRKIAITLEKNALLGTMLRLKCENHQTICTISSPKDFDKVPEGGCLLKCGYNLPCGHRCPLICHGYDRGHVKIECHQKCERLLCGLGHVCPLKCSMECEPCTICVRRQVNNNPLRYERVYSSYTDNYGYRWTPTPKPPPPPVSAVEKYCTIL